MFKTFKKSVQDRISFLVENSVSLFEVSIDKDSFWELYLDSYAPGTNDIYRERREYDCSCCRQFVKQYGSIVGIIDGEMVSIWDVEVESPFQVVADKLNEHIQSLPIANVFYSKFPQLGTDYNFELIEDESTKWEHFFYKLPTQLVNKSDLSIESLQGAVRQTRDVTFRSFNELTPSSIDTVLELIKEKSLYRGEEHKAVLEKFKTIQRQFILSQNKENFAWEVAVKNGRVAAIRNTAIGTLLINLSAGMDLEIAVKKFESVVAPANYKRPKALFTKSMREAAERKVAELGLMDSLARRHAVLEDISIQNVIWASGESKKVMQSPFDMIAGDEKASLGKYEHAQEMGVDYFIENVLPTAKKIELMLDNAHSNNLVSLIAPQDKDAPTMFKWNNGFSWAYNGDFTDSIKESVKAMGGKVDGVLRFSLSWAEGDGSDNSDLDAHCKLPGAHIYYSNDKDHKSGGHLDVDITSPNRKNNKHIVENITWGDKKKMPKGKYFFSVNNYALRGSQKGFTAEIEFDGKIHTFSWANPLRDKEQVKVATVEFDGTNFKITDSLPLTQTSKEVWSVPTMKFVPVTTVMYSPNHWDGQGVGNRHYFFMLEGCTNASSPRGFFNEFLRNDLDEHKRVLEALGAKMKVEHSDHQLSGVGYSSTMKNSVIIKIDSKPIKLNFTDDKLILKSSKAKVSV